MGGCGAFPTVDQACSGYLVEQVPADSARHLNSARQAGRYAAAGGYNGSIDVATGGLVIQPWRLVESHPDAVP